MVRRVINLNKLATEHINLTQIPDFIIHKLLFGLTKQIQWTWLDFWREQIHCDDEQLQNKYIAMMSSCT